MIGDKIPTTIRLPAEVYEKLRSDKISHLVILIGGESKRNPDPISDFDVQNAQLTDRLLDLMKQGRLEFVPVPESGRYLLLKVVY